MNYEGILEFHGTWRSYQARVLQNVSRYLSDDKIHIVAAPGSGKTTLGIELIKRLNANTLILAPSITIREQWAARIQEAFLCDGYTLEDYVSLSLKQPKAQRSGPARHFRKAVKLSSIVRVPSKSKATRAGASKGSGRTGLEAESPCASSDLRPIVFQSRPS